MLDDDVSAGDFVRNIRQVVDLLSQIADVAPDHETRRKTQNAISVIDRDLVTAAARVYDELEERDGENAD